jgi:hypothetical protein
VSDVLGVGFGAKKARGLLPPGFLIAFVDNANAEAMTVTRMFFKALVRTGRLKLFVGLDYSYESAEVNKVGWEQFMNTCRFLGLCRAGCWRRAGETFELVALSDRSIENEFHRILTKADTEWTATQKAFTLLFEIEWLVRKVDLKRKRRA